MPEDDLSKTGVYQWRNTVNGKVYVGSAAISFKNRKKGHLDKLRAGKHKNLHFQAAWNKYGEASFEFSVLEECKPEKCLEYEQDWIDHKNARDPKVGYNKASATSTFGHKLSVETRAKMSASRKGMKLRLGCKLSEEHKAALLKANTGKKHTQEAKDRVRAARLGIPYDPEAMAKLPPVTPRGTYVRKKPEGSKKSEGPRVFSSKHRTALSVAAKLRWEKQRQESKDRDVPNLTNPQTS